MTTAPTPCPNCGANTVQGQLVPMKNVAAGMLTALFTDDVAAGVLVAQSGKLIVQSILSIVWHRVASLPALLGPGRPWRIGYGTPRPGKART